MTRFLTWTASLLIVAAAVPASAQQETAAAAPAAAPAPEAEAAPARKICRTTQVTGRRITKKTCYTAEQWAELRRVRQEAADKLVSDMNGQGAKGNLGSGSSGSLSTGAMFGLGQ